MENSKNPKVSTRNKTKKEKEVLKPLMEDMNPHPEMTGLDEAKRYEESFKQNNQ
jgi:hypothetical protein